MAKKISQPSKNQRALKYYLASLFGLGELTASGTWGSFVTMILAVFLAKLPCGILWGVILSFLIGLWAIPMLIKGQKDKDPGYIIIDEVLGQLVVFVCIPTELLNPVLFVFGFLFFRLFDILKPWPASYFDKKVHNALGIMMDDFVAGIFSALALALMQMLSIL